jgi:hypothetical protein
MPNMFQGFHGRLTAALAARAAAGDREDTDPTSMNHAKPIHVFPTHFGSNYGVRAPSKPYRYPTASARNIISNVSPSTIGCRMEEAHPRRENASPHLFQIWTERTLQRRPHLHQIRKFHDRLIRLYDGASFLSGPTSQSTGGSSVFIDFGHCLQ